ncbi:ADP-ribose pyrophosphatase YjhB, NUDIX family [Consotaella salsifontis]|uniref:ADP-ribose pyrophosphatase YjhB, NUDIX family n=2 Tax=Consotaella salsifontis TaxID=1365950 RepID=A0A1T4T6I5_9HYPH|nr:ADP-ribose pyrophosphatase YjhB, NUDIX family [Consotaella salsifontis]
MEKSRPLLGVSACIFSGERILLVERSQPPYAGILSLPGGKVEFGEALESAARREVVEETGITLGALAFLKFHEILIPEHAVHVVLAVFVALEDVDGTTRPTAGDDARSARFHTPAELDALHRADRLTDGLIPIVQTARAFRQS